MRLILLCLMLVFSGCVVSVPVEKEEPVMQELTDFVGGVAAVQKNNAYLHISGEQDVVLPFENVIAVNWLSELQSLAVYSRTDGSTITLIDSLSGSSQVLYRSSFVLSDIRVMHTTNALLAIEDGNLLYIDAETGAVTRIVEDVYEYAVSAFDRKIWYQSEEGQKVVSMNVSGKIQETTSIDFAPVFHAVSFENKNRVIGVYVEDGEVYIARIHLSKEEIEEKTAVEFSDLPLSARTILSPEKTYLALEYVSERFPDGHIQLFDMDDFELVDVFEAKQLQWETDSSFMYMKKNQDQYDLFEKNSILDDSNLLITQAEHYSILTP